MKKLLMMIPLFCLCTCLFASCGIGAPVLDNAPTDSDSTIVQQDTAATTTTAPTEEIPIQENNGPTEQEKVEALMETLLLSKTAEEAAAVMTESNEDIINSVLSITLPENYTVTAEKLGTHENDPVYRFTCTNTDDDSVVASGINMYVVNGDSLLMETNGQKLDALINACTCSTCSGSGSLHTGGTACGICGGSGFQWIPNAYFDGTMWQGMNQACGGCGGAGYIGMQSTACSACGGDGITL